MKVKPSSLIPAALLCAVLIPAPAPAQDGYNIYLTAKENAGVPLREPATTFSCSDRIYAVVEINHPGGGTGLHTLYATWRNPAGEDQEITQYQFQLTEGYALIWAWLKLERSGAAAAVQFMNPSAGLEEFVGNWELRIRIDDQQIGKKQFEVIC